MKIAARFLVFVSVLIISGACASYQQTLPPTTSQVTATTGLDEDESVTESSAVAEAENTFIPLIAPEQDDLAAIDPSLAPAENDIPPEPVRTSQSILDEALEYCQAAQDYWQKGELDNGMDALDSAYALILKVDTENNPKLIQQKEDLRITISKQIQLIYASRFTVVNGNGKEIPMDFNEHIEKEIKLFQGNEKKFFLASYQRSGKYRDMILKALKENGLPEELSWLPLIESGFKVNALSRAQALGLWQFIASTGYKFGLTRDTYIDERMDPEKATAAAIAYLTELHQIFGDWKTVLAAYNCGEGRVLRVIRQQKEDYLDNFWDLYQLLPRETARYVPRFYATLHILNDPEKYGLELPEPDAPLEFETVEVNRQVDLSGISKELNIPESELKALNPELRYSLLPAEPYTLRMPPGKSEQLLASIDTIAVSYPPQNAYTKHRIRSGETLSTIAARYKTSVRKIMQANNLSRSNYIVAGKTLKIPLRGAVTTRSTAASTQTGVIPQNHVVRRGDSLWIIAKKYGTTVQRIQALNSLTTTTLSIGQVLKISDSPSSIDTAKLRTYTVKKGDSPFTIAKRHNTSLEKLLQLNNLSKKSVIYPGQTLYID